MRGVSNKGIGCRRTMLFLFSIVFLAGLHHRNSPAFQLFHCLQASGVYKLRVSWPRRITPICSGFRFRFANPSPQNLSWLSLRRSKMAIVDRRTTGHVVEDFDWRHRARCSQMLLCWRMSTKIFVLFSSWNSSKLRKFREKNTLGYPIALVNNLH